MSAFDGYRCELRLRGITLKEVLGQGKFSTVYRAFDRFAGLSVAVKCVRRHSSPTVQTNASGATLREIVIWRTICHPYIIAFYSFFSGRKMNYLILEFISGSNLLEYMLKLSDHLVSEVIMRRWAAQLADAVAHLHSRAIAHRDIKLENILVSESDSTVKLGDFGFAKAVVEGAKEFRGCGSTSYASPQILLGVPYDAKSSDIFALGCVYYALLTGALPFTDTVTVPHQLEMRRNQVFEWNHADRVSRTTRRLIHHMLHFKEDCRISASRLLECGFVRDCQMVCEPGHSEREAEGDGYFWPDFQCCLT